MIRTLCDPAHLISLPALGGYKENKCSDVLLGLSCNTLENVVFVQSLRVDVNSSTRLVSVCAPVCYIMSPSAQADLGELTQALVAAETKVKESRKALQSLSTSLRQSHNSWPTLDLIRCHSKLSRSLREATPLGDSNESVELIKDTANRIKHTYGSLAEFIPHEQRAALFTTEIADYISHDYLRGFVADFTLPLEANGTLKPVVSVALPNGPLLAAVLMGVTAHYTAAPINPTAGAEQFQADVTQATAKCILTAREEYLKLELEGWAQDNGIAVLLVELTRDMRIAITTPDGVPTSAPPTPPNTADDIALVLFTSGTSGEKKVVPITTHSIVAGVAFVVESWALTPKDVCLNMMPLYHMYVLPHLP